jgi:hypothetical protein
VTIEATITGALIGGAIGLGFWTVTFTGLDRRFPGAFGSVGLLSLVASCLWFDGWIAVAIGAFCVTLSGLLVLGGGGRGPRRARRLPASRPAGVRAVARRANGWTFAPMPPRTVFATAQAHRPLASAASHGN